MVISILFFVMCMRPPSSTLFPYTTLFRSCRGVGLPAGTLGDLAVGKESAGEGYAAHRQAFTQQGFETFADDELGAAATDRKSTRLNSSHVRISYAVFCLKKKNKQKRNKYN